MLILVYVFEKVSSPKYTKIQSSVSKIATYDIFELAKISFCVKFWWR